jgi:pimeloyl-ACP methyl ester carboxylesterase
MRLPPAVAAVTFITCGCLALMSAQSSPPPPLPPPAETVVLLHGIAMPALVMHRLADACAAAGYRVVNLPYPSRALTLEQLARDYLPAQLAVHGAGTAPRLHFVAHSMGGMVVRLFLDDRRPPNLGRVVLLGPPNAGSAVADRLSRSALCRWLVGPNLSRLGTETPDAIAPQLPPPDYEVGVIAGSANLNPLFSHWQAGPNDGAVSITSARLAGGRDFLVVPHSHTAMLWRRGVAQQVLAFLRTGRFARSVPGGAV